jgi:hypothetical protein
MSAGVSARLVILGVSLVVAACALFFYLGSPAEVPALGAPEDSGELELPSADEVDLERAPRDEVERRTAAVPETKPRDTRSALSKSRLAAMRAGAADPVEPLVELRVLVVDPRGTPVARAVARAQFEHADHPVISMLQAPTDDRGVATIRAREWKRVSVDVVPPEGASHLGPGRHVVDDASLRTVRVELPSQHAIIVVAKDASGAAVPHLDRIDLIDPKTLRSISRMQVDSDTGIYAIDSTLEQMDVLVSALAVGVGRASVPCCNDRERTVEVVLTSRVGIHGRVLDQGLPVEEARVVLFRTSKAALDQRGRMIAGHPVESGRRCVGDVMSDRDGRYRFQPDEPGSYALEVRFDARGAAVTAPFVLESGGIKELDLDLVDAPPLVVEIKGPDGVRARGRLVMVHNLSGWSAEAWADERGICEILGVPAGAYSVGFGSMEFSSLPKEAACKHHFSTTGDASTRVALSLDASAVRRIRITALESRHTIHRARLYWHDGGPHLVDESKSNSRSIELKAGQSGRHTLVVEARQQGSQRPIVLMREIELDANDLEIRLDPPPIEAIAAVDVSKFAQPERMYCVARGADGLEAYYPFRDCDRARNSPKGRVSLCADVPVDDLRIVTVQNDGSLSEAPNRFRTTAGERTLVSLD